ncbi:rubredoxin [Stenotrophobium rhamnosiphilum]|uniref:Rubredoxin n=1 Tax=Stenotrophobium rhamnosiphilum TaxID=2029166 RepID=A0A2T5MCX4_9GAMM|nr:rubredoxin [Stenotrophobium rhamnosiphilum]PTU30407.1 rubredoxin [Stenotrophobium rhamnosiphilum]
MQKWICVICGYIYDEAVGIPAAGIAAGTTFADLPEEWTCPECGSPKESFEVYAE